MKIKHNVEERNYGYTDSQKKLLNGQLDHLTIFINVPRALTHAQHKSMRVVY